MIKKILMMSVAALCVMACDDDDDVTTVDLTGTYEGYTTAECAYFSDYYTDGEILTITANADGTLKLSLSSATWGTFTVESVTYASSSTGYAIAGSGTVDMGMSSTTTYYDFTMSGLINEAKDDFSIVFSVPSVMGGLTVTMLPGSAPATEE